MRFQAHIRSFGFNLIKTTVCIIVKVYSHGAIAKLYTHIQRNIFNNVIFHFGIDIVKVGITVFASEMTAAKTLADCDFSVPAAIVMGSEDKGIYPALLKICDEGIKIPMKNNFESLNVSVATGMILYEVMTQRGI